MGEERRQHPPYRLSIGSIDRTERSTILVTAHTRPNPSISQQQGVLDRAPCAEMRGVFTLGTNFLPENRASEPQPPCPTSTYLINTLGWRWARRELSEQPQRSTWNTGSNVRNWQRAKMAFEQGAGDVVRDWLFALARRGGAGGMSGSRPPPPPICQCVAQSDD